MLSSVVCYSFKYHLKVYEHWKRTEYQRRIWKFEAVGINDFIYDGHCRIIDRISNLTCISHRGWFQFRDFWISYLMTGVYIKSNQLMVILCHLTYSEVVILCYNSQELFFGISLHNPKVCEFYLTFAFNWHFFSLTSTINAFVLFVFQLVEIFFCSSCFEESGRDFF